MKQPGRRRLPENLLLKLILPLALLVAWKLVTTLTDISSILLPKPESVLRDLFTYIGNGEVLHHTLVSLRRCFIGFAAGSAAGIFLGVVLGWFKRLEAFFDVVFGFMRSVPKTALAPLLIVWFGFGESPKILLIGLAAFFYTLIPTIEGVRNVDRMLIKSARSLGANQAQIISGVILPAALPTIYAGIRIAATSSLVVLVFVEIIAGNDGLGFLLEDARESLNMSTMFMTLIVIGILGFALDGLVRFTEKAIMPWQKGKTLSS